MEIMIFVLGLCCGSFVNMLVYRTAERYELESKKFKVKSKNRSFCDYCGKQLHWYENIPVISWLLQKGRTKCCHKKLPILYPIVEIMTGILFLITNYKLLITNNELQITNYFGFVISLIIVTFLVFSTVFDLKYMILPDFSTVILTSSALLLWCLGHFGEWNYLLSAIVSFGFLGLLYFFTKGKGMGLGDVKLAFFMGLFLGPQKTILAFYVAFVVGALVSLVLMVLNKANKKSLIAFGPFLILGTITAWFWGNKLISLSVGQFFR